MSGASIGSLLVGTAATATANISAAIWRSSYDVNDPRAKVGRPFGDGSTAQSLTVIEAIIETARAYAKASKPDGKAHDLTCNMIETLSCIFRSFMTFSTGVCEPSYEMIMKATTFSRDTVNRHINGLRALGWLDWCRRTKRTKKGHDTQTTSQYFFEISRLPLKAQIHLRQLLKRKGITLLEHPERQGSGSVPNLAQRIAERIAKGCRVVTNKFRGDRYNYRLLDDAAFVQGEVALFGDIPVGQWAKLRHPNDIHAQQAYNARLGIASFCGLPSPTLVIDSPPQN